MAELRGVNGRLTCGLTAWALIAHAVGIECPNSRTDFGHSAQAWLIGDRCDKYHPSITHLSLHLNHLQSTKKCKISRKVIDSGEKMKNFTCARARVRGTIKQRHKRTTTSIGKAFGLFYVIPNIGAISITWNIGWALLSARSIVSERRCETKCP